MSSPETTALLAWISRWLIRVAVVGFPCWTVFAFWFGGREATISYQMWAWSVAHDPWFKWGVLGFAVWLCHHFFWA
jgi:hypothetical protein